MTDDAARLEPVGRECGDRRLGPVLHAELQICGREVGLHSALSNMKQFNVDGLRRVSGFLYITLGWISIVTLPQLFHTMLAFIAAVIIAGVTILGQGTDAGFSKVTFPP